MKLVIDISEGLKDAFNHEEQWTALLCADMRDVLKNGTPLPKGHGRIIDESKITSIYHHEEKAKQGAIRFNWIAIDGTDAPTIIEADGGEKDEET